MHALNGRWAVVTGAAGGIGRDIAIALSSAGMRVVVGDLNPPKEDAPLPVGVRFVLAEVCDPGDLEKLADACGGEAPAVWVNNAGIAPETGNDSLLRNKNAKNWRKTIDVNIKAVIEGTQIAIHRNLDARKGGAAGPCYIVSTASSAGLIPRATSVYAAAKAGVVHFTRSVAEQVRLDKITDVHIYCLCPSLTDTQMVRDMGGSFMKKVEGTITPSAKIAEGLIRLIDESAPNGSAMLFDTANGVTTASLVPYGEELGGPLPRREPVLPAKL